VDGLRNCLALTELFTDIAFNPGFAERFLNPVQPECLDITAVKREFGDRLVFWGGIGTQTTMAFSSPDDVYRTVQRTIDFLGPTGYLPCPTHVLEPEVPWDNILAFLRAVDEYRP
jgi:uroporphyrinogen decarboxylase